MTFLVRALTALALTLATCAAQAQQANPAGQWYCEMGFQNTAPGVKPNPVGMRFQMVVYGNGTAQGQGQDVASSGAYPFQFQARWALQGSQFVVQGVKYGGIGFNGQGQFIFESKMQGPNNMAYTQRYQNQKMQVYASQCQRQG